MKNFDHKEPYIYKDKSNKKWCIRYSIRYPGEKEFEPRKEYGKAYRLSPPLNSITDLKERDKVAHKLLRYVEADLEDGIDKKKPEIVKAIIAEQIKEIKKSSYDESVNFYMDILGFNNPKPKQKETAKQRIYFFKNQFRKFVIEKKLDTDIRLVTKAHILEFLNSYYLNTNPELKWGNNTYNDKRVLLFGFFRILVEQERLEDNPVAKTQAKPKAVTERYAIFTKDERDIVFQYFDESNKCIAMILRILYYAYIRDTETHRLKISDFNLEDRKIRIAPENAKGQKDNLVRWVVMSEQLKTAIITYLNAYPNEPDFYMVGKKCRPSKYPLLMSWKREFNVGFKILKEKHPTLFNRPGLTPYSFKHSGVTHFINDNMNDKSKTELLRFVQAQCRHEKFATTEIYLKRLELDMSIQDTYFYD